MKMSDMKERFSVYESKKEEATVIWDHLKERSYDAFEWDLCDRDTTSYRSEGMCYILNKLENFLGR